MGWPRQITVLLADDHRVVREGLRELLKMSGDIVVVGEAGTGREAVRLARDLQPEIILMDISMPELNGLEATRQILAARPEAKVIFLTAHDDGAYVERVSTIGAAGFLEKATSTETLAKAVREVAAGNAYFSPAIARRLRAWRRQRQVGDGQAKAGSPQLTSREAEVLQLVTEGWVNKQVAAQLGLSNKTVEKHRQRLMDKLNIHDIAGLTRYALARGIVENRVRLNFP
jgi:DNA-binding NarL/FixJ family response regulator